MTPHERFEAKVSPEPTSGCHLWTGAIARFGHGSFRYEGRTRVAHRVAWELAHGPVPEGLCVLHRCDVPGCVNVQHLFLGTQDDNVKDMVVKGRVQRYNSAKTHCKYGHPFSGDNLYIHKDGHRQCLACTKRVTREWRRKRRAARVA